MAALNENNGNSHSTTLTGPTPCHCLRTKNPVPFFHPLQIWFFLTAVNAKASTRQTWHIGHVMVLDLCTLLVQTIGQITVHLLFGPVSHVPHSFPRSMASSSKAQGEPSQAPASDLHADMHALVENEYGTNDTPPTELKRAASPGGDSTTEPKRPKPTPAGPEKNPTGPPNPTPPAGAEVAASPNLTPPQDQPPCASRGPAGDGVHGQPPKDGRHYSPRCMRTELQRLGLHRNRPGANQGGWQNGRQDL
jgi:hypothetical protein